jgi:peptide deformylase
MATYRVMRFDEPPLRRKAKKVKEFDDGLKALAQDMLETMHASNGVGLAAPQVGISQRLIVVQLPPEEPAEEEGETPAAEQQPPAPSPVFVLANPEIVEQSEEQEVDEEGCLSVPGIVGEVSRPAVIKLRAQNLKGKPVRLTAEGYLARVFQHEMDHLDGVLFIDRVEGADKLRRITRDGASKPIEPAA